MRLMLTRPMADAASLAEQAARLGHDVVLAPMISIEPLPASLPAADGFDALALTSANGVRALWAAMADAAVAVRFMALPAYAVGPQTAAALTACGWPEVHQAAGDVAALATRIAADAPSRVLHIAGTHLAGDLAAALQVANIVYNKAVLYEALAAEEFTMAAAAALTDPLEPVEAVLFYSQRSAKIFCHLYTALSVPDGVAKPLAFCLSPAIADVMHQAGFETRIAATPEGEAMLDLLR